MTEANVQTPPAPRLDAEQRQRIDESIVSSTPDLVYVFDLDCRRTGGVCTIGFPVAFEGGPD